MDISFDLSEVQAYAARLPATTQAVPSIARTVVTKGALNVKNEARGAISAHPSWKRLAQTINYQMTGNKSFSQAEIGYDDVGQGELAGIAEVGSSRHAPHPALFPAFEAEVPRFEKAMGEAIGKAIGGIL